jgi:hypothetical protein
MTNQYFMDRFGTRNPELRAADADRERVAERLRKSHAEGRLDLGEFQERLERCYEAKTMGELDALVTDLPRQEDNAERRPAGGFLPGRMALVPLAPILIALLVVSAAIGHHFFWLWISLVFFLWRMSGWRRSRSWAGPRHGPHGWR